jgi:hypothetical protein
MPQKLHWRTRHARLLGRDVPDSTGINVLVSAHKKSFQAGGRIILHGMQPAQMRVIQICGLTGYLDFAGDGHGDVPQELVDAARQELEYPADETNEG